MPDRRRHRGPHPNDAQIFAVDRLPNLRAAVDDLSLLLTRGYSDVSALKLVGDRYGLTARQRQAVMRCSCTDAARDVRAKKEVRLPTADERPLLIDAYNLLITVESALSRGVVLVGRDGCVRDLAGLHGTYRTVDETLPALQLVGSVLNQSHRGEVTWYLDAPVSNSRRLAALIRETGAKHSWSWSTDVVANPDTILAQARDCYVASSDSWILDHAEAWIALSRYVIEAAPTDAWSVDLTPALPS